MELLRPESCNAVVEEWGACADGAASVVVHCRRKPEPGVEAAGGSKAGPRFEAVGIGVGTCGEDGRMGCVFAKGWESLEEGRQGTEKGAGASVGEA